MATTTSVVLCTYNGARYLPAQWASVLAQSRLPDEIVVRDDASTDATAALLDQLAADARARGVAVKLIRGEHNLGYVANFQAALQEASGEVLFLCDQDDIWHPHKLATQLAAFERRPALLLLCTDARRVDAAGNNLRGSLFNTLRVTAAEWRCIRGGRGFEVLLRRNMATGATIALRRSLMADARPFPVGWVHDEWLAIIAAAMGGFDGLEFALIDYRQHPGNQLGMPHRNRWQRLKDLLNPPATDMDALIAREGRLLARLAQLGKRAPATATAQAREKLAHLEARRAATGAPWSRLGPVLREALYGRYRRFGAGWRTAVRDVIRRR